MSDGSPASELPKAEWGWTPPDPVSGYEAAGYIFGCREEDGTRPRVVEVYARLEDHEEYQFFNLIRSHKSVNVRADGVVVAEQVDGYVAPIVEVAAARPLPEVQP